MGQMYGESMPFYLRGQSCSISSLNTRDLLSHAKTDTPPADRQVDFDDDDEDDEIEQITAPRPAEEVHSRTN